MATVIKTKLSVQMLCSAKKVIANMADDKKSVVVGTIYGKADKVGVRTSPDGTKEFEAIYGDFEGVPADPAEDTIRSGILYLPDFAHPLVAEPLKMLDKDGNRVNAMVQFAFEVSVERASNPQGYSWGLQPLGEPSATDPLADLRKQIAERSKRQLPAPEKSEPAKASGGKKR